MRLKPLLALAIAAFVLPAGAFSSVPESEVAKTEDSRESERVTRDRAEYLSTYVGRYFYRGARIPVRALLGMDNYYSDRPLYSVSIDFNADQATSLVLLLDGSPVGRPQYVSYDGYVSFALPYRRNIIDRNFRNVQILVVTGGGFAAQLSAEVGDDWGGGRPIPPGPGPYPPGPGPYPPGPGPYPPGPGPYPPGPGPYPPGPGPYPPGPGPIRPIP
jgi:hypothetical protein